MPLFQEQWVQPVIQASEVCLVLLVQLVQDQEPDVENVKFYVQVSNDGRSPVSSCSSKVAVDQN